MGGEEAPNVYWGTYNQHRRWTAESDEAEVVRIVSISVPLPSANEPNTMAPLARQHESLRKIGVDVDALEIHGPAKLKYALTLRELHRRLDSCDVVHAHYGFAGWLGRLQRRRPLVVSFMGSDLLGTPGADGSLTRASSIEVAANRRFASMADQVIVKSRELGDVISSVNCHVVPNGVDVEEFSPIERRIACTRLGWDPEVTRVLFAGNPGDPRKGFALASEAIEKLRITSGRAVEIAVLHKVKAHDVANYMNACDAMIMTSLWEGSPNVVKEAMACNLPVASVPVGDVDFLFDGAAGYSVVGRVADELAVALDDALRNQEPVEGRTALMAKGLDSESVAHKLADIYTLACT